jgi:hypothetical protein
MEKMKNKLIVKGLVCGIILLFVGIGFIPYVNATSKSKIEKNCHNSSRSDGPGVDNWQSIDIVGDWHFDEGQGYIANDSSNYSNNGSCIRTEWTTGYNSFALNFSDAANSDVMVEDAPSLNFDNLGENEGFKIDFWMIKNQSANPGYLDGLVCKEASSSGYRVALMPDPEKDQISFWIGNGQTGEGKIVISNTKITDYNWHHIVAIWDGGIMYLYIDNMDTPDNSLYVGNFTIAYCWKWLDIGNHWPTDNLNAFDGKIDEVRISRIIPTNGNIPPVVSFGWSPKYPIANEPITFNASASYDPDGSITLYEWDWNNDGIYDESHTTPTAIHTWISDGEYPVTLRVTDNGSATNIRKETVYVGNQPPSVEITFPKPVDWLSKTVNITGAAHDPNGDNTIILVQVNLDPYQNPGAWQDASGTSSWTYTWDTTQNADKTYSISVRSKDSSGTYSNVISIPVNVDNTPPVVRMITPINGHFYLFYGAVDRYIIWQYIIPYSFIAIRGLKVSCNATDKSSYVSEIEVWFEIEDNVYHMDKIIKNNWLFLYSGQAFKPYFIWWLEIRAYDAAGNFCSNSIKCVFYYNF